MTSGIKLEVTVAMMRKAGIMPDIRLKTTDMVVENAGFDRPGTLKIAT